MTGAKSQKRFKLKGLKVFGVLDLVLLAMLTALSIAFKAVVGILIRFITGPLGIPGGALAGGLYMLWLPLAIALTGKRGSAALIAAVQVVVMVTTGAPGSHGVWTPLTYMPPAVLAELVFLYRPKNYYNAAQYVVATILANIAGTFGSNLLFFRMSLIPLLFTLLAASLSGALGGLVAFFAYNTVKKSGVLDRLRRSSDTVSSAASPDAAEQTEFFDATVPARALTKTDAARDNDLENSPNARNTRGADTEQSPNAQESRNKDIVCSPNTQETYGEHIESALNAQKPRDEDIENSNARKTNYKDIG